VRSVFADGPITCVTTSEYLDQRGNVAGHSKAASFPVHREDSLPKTVRGWSARVHAEERRLFGGGRTVELPPVARPVRHPATAPVIRLEGEVVRRYLAWCAKTGTHPASRLRRMLTEFCTNAERKLGGLRGR
jgi:hypothetical protein